MKKKYSKIEIEMGLCACVCVYVQSTRLLAQIGCVKLTSTNVVRMQCACADCRNDSFADPECAITNN